MLREEAILRTKLIPPRPQRHILARPRVDVLLREALDYRVTIVQASAGCGKSTALANLANANVPLFWYNASEGDSDVQQFLTHLIAAFRLGLPDLGDAPLALLQDAYAGAARVAADALLNALNDLLTSPSLLVIDDYHLAASNSVDVLLDHFLAFLPHPLHVIVSTRYATQWENLVSWRARGQVLEIKRNVLAFNFAEIIALFRDLYGFTLSPREAEMLEEKTEGWPIALQLVWQEMRANPQTTVAALLLRESHAARPIEGSLDTLFAYLARDVLAQQPQEIQDLLLRTSVLRELDAASCDAITGRNDSHAMLAHLRERDLFVTAVGDEHYRYHPLFHDFLREQARRQDAPAVRDRHRRAGEFFHRAGSDDEAIYHFLQADAFDAAAGLIEATGEGVLRAGRLDTLAGWIDVIPPEQVAAHPLLMFYLGDLARLRSQFTDALAWYAQAERAWRAANDIRGVSRALRGMALVHLDTVNPARAEDLLQEALRLSDGVDDRLAQARLLELLAENKLNMGKAEEAERLRAQARTLREEGPSEDALSVRVKLRTGRLDEAREILEAWAHTERGQLRPPRAARETLLILSLIYSMQGRGYDAFDTAKEGIVLGAQLHSPFVTAVGHMRLGHAHQMCGDLPAAIRCYEEAIALGDQLAVPRTRAEAMWGITRAYGFGGDLESARRSASEGIEIGRNAGDAWVVALVRLALGASHVLARHDREGIAILADALAAYRSCGDAFGSAAARLWLALGHWNLHQRERALTHLDEALALAQSHHYDYLFVTRTLLGWQTVGAIPPLLLEARRRNLRLPYTTRLLAAMGLENVTAHPAYPLRLQTLGAFRAWRGESEVSPREWQRNSARQLLQLFVTHRGRLLQREEIFEFLWSNESPDAAARDLKVALNALNKALEPNRAATDAPAFIVRAGSSYGLRVGVDVWVDADEFTELLTRADAARSSGDAALNLYHHALALYQDDFLMDARYEGWASAERERLLALYLRAADRLAQESLARGDAAGRDECLAWCEHILARDRCWEHAYRMMMRVYAERGDRAQARRVFDRCAGVLREELDVEPSEATVEVFREVVAAEKVEGEGRGSAPL